VAIRAGPPADRHEVPPCSFGDIHCRDSVEREAVVRPRLKRQACTASAAFLRIIAVVVAAAAADFSSPPT
jgi:hypothetical protein